jgi:hypothetical protein
MPARATPEPSAMPAALPPPSSHAPVLADRPPLGHVDTPAGAAQRAVQRAVQVPTPEDAAATPTAPRRLSARVDAPVLTPMDTTGQSVQSRPDHTDQSAWTDAGEVAVANGVAQRQADGSVVFSPAPDDAPAVQAASAPATPSAAAPAQPGAAGADLDELAKRLYGRLRVMLKHELRLDRERAGLLTHSRNR